MGSRIAGRAPPGAAQVARWSPVARQCRRHRPHIPATPVRPPATAGRLRRRRRYR